MELNFLNGHIILGLDISTTCTGISVAQYDNDELKILYINRIKFKVPKNVRGTESLFLKASQFRDCYNIDLKRFKITDIIIEQPLLRSNNVNTVGTLLQFNGMLSQIIYDTTGIIPHYISSHDARKYAFPSLNAIRKTNKKGEAYPIEKVRKSINANELVLFGEYQWDCDKKYILWNRVSELYPDIDWDYNKKGELKTENFDASDSLVCILGYVNKEKYGEINPTIVSHEEKIIELDGKNHTQIDYEVEFCGEIICKTIRF